MKDEFDKDEATTLVTCVDKNDKWIIDSGYSQHMTGDNSKFITLNFYDGNSVGLINDAPCLIKGKGSIKLIYNILCDNTYYVEGLKYNLLSVSQLNNLGCKVEFENKTTKIYDTNENMIGKGDQTRGNIFYLDIDDFTCLIVKTDDVWLWHKRIFHVKFNKLISINNMKKVRGFPKLKKLDNIIRK